MQTSSYLQKQENPDLTLHFLQVKRESDTLLTFL